MAVRMMSLVYMVPTPRSSSSTFLLFSLWYNLLLHLAETISLIPQLPGQKFVQLLAKRRPISG
jgi:hypothetical protein